MNRSQRLLVIDDDPFIHRLVSARLNDLDVTILAAFDGQSGLDAAREQSPDLILLDVNLPDTSGFDVCEKLRNDPATQDSPILFLTGTEAANEKVRAFELGAVDYVTKPFHAAELRARVRAALRTQALLDALERQALSDALTHLPNRAAFRRALAKRIESARQSDRPSQFALMFLDLDRFKIINDSLGHEIGDQLLIEVANRIHECTRRPEINNHSSRSKIARSGDIVARMGGDEFAILLADVTDEQAVTSIATRITDEVSRPYHLAGHEVSCGVSIGIRMCDGGKRESVEAIIRDGDTAMYQAKASGKGCHVFFNEEMHQKALERIEMEDGLRLALRRHELQLAYQPIVNLATGLLEGFEALIRWHHPTRGLISPDCFIPIAEETGIIHEMGVWILEQACKQALKWNRQFGTNLKIHINASKAQFSSETFVDQIAEIIKTTAMNPHLLVIEVTESLIMHDSRIVVPCLDKLRRLGVKLAMDDFGTGYSSLAALHRFPLDILKIDREFIQRLSASRPYAAIVEAIVTLAHNLGLAVTAEGVEQQDELITLQSLDCDYAQGFYFSKPVSSHDATALLRADCEARKIAA